MHLLSAAGLGDYGDRVLRRTHSLLSAVLITYVIIPPVPQGAEWLLEGGSCKSLRHWGLQQHHCGSELGTAGSDRGPEMVKQTHSCKWK